MKRLDLLQARRFSSRALAMFCALAIVAALPLTTLAASFDADVGFDLTTLGGVDLVIDPNVELVDANDLMGPGTTDVQIDGSFDLCILVGAGTTCDTSAFIGDPAPVAFLVTLTVAAINNPDISGPFTLILRDLNPDPGYARSAITVDTDYAAIPNLDPNGFDFDASNGINGFDPFIVIEDRVAEDDIRYYLGWTVMLGESVTFRFDLEEGVIRNQLPFFEFSAIPTTVPEPGTALLMGLGLAGLCAAGRRDVMRVSDRD